MDNAKRFLRKVLWGLVWVGAGAYLLLANHGAFDLRFSLRADWPVILVLIGISVLIDSIG